MLDLMNYEGSKIREGGIFQIVDIYENLKQLVRLSFNEKNI